jgi:hypothetical protein
MRHLSLTVALELAGLRSDEKISTSIRSRGL